MRMENENPIRFIAVVVVVVAAVSHNAQHMLLFEFICALNICVFYMNIFCIHVSKRTNSVFNPPVYFVMVQPFLLNMQRKSVRELFYFN